MSNEHRGSDIAIIGIGCRFPDAADDHQFWQNILGGKVAFRDVPKDRWDHAGFFSKHSRDIDKTWAPRGSFIEGYRDFAALEFGISPRRLEVMDPQHRLLIETTRVALLSAGYETRPF